ncbi:LuxR C-terminal-related transcriptional regulator [Amycolatopsis sp. SID8362]|uniref:ATP-binding protein n=1 Tax=Amycolatopsis sp. SID8362 TaxID=2690346 RepID=UPI00136FEDC4|nr:LuxR C-terminal-related transcriptional regulator [Amycolatopsis sp. SID8362]NBH11301.1 AAA family ATPase [Amycolatopsis sp. SID8362]NED47993.1 AAA family ATPase [Amycolatopsis sp. SID8362]
MTADGARRDLTSYMGRAEDEREVRRLLGEARLVTLTGPGGVGKTRLAGRVASSVTRAFPDGVVVAGLAELRDATMVTRTLADCLGLHDTAARTARDTVLAHLRERRMLLLLDNCEHLVAPCAELADDLLRQCPDLVILATSRCSLGVAGERVLPVAPLAVPPETAETVEDAIAYDAVRLFVDRASEVLPSFRLTEDNAAAVVGLCRQLDGLPLAVELAAARIRVLSPGQIADRMSASLAVLTTGARSLPERHRSLRATIEGSHALCTDVERAVWECCSVFAGAFDLAAAEDVCAAPGPAGLDALAVLDAVEGLVDKSVLLRVEGAAVRFRMLEALREFGQERLAGAGIAEAIARRHRDHHVRLLDQADAEWFGPRRDDWFARLSDRHADIRAALSWSLRDPGEAAVVLRIASGVIEYWMARGAAWEIREWLDRALAVAAEDAPGRARAQARAALCAALHADLDGARHRLKLAESSGDDDAVPYLCHARAFVALIAVEPHALENAAEAVRIFGERGAVRSRLHPMFIQAVATAYRGDLAGARHLLAEMLRLCESARDESYRSMALFGLGTAEIFFGGDLDVGERAMRDALEIDLRGPDVLSAAYRVDGLAWASARREDWPGAARLFGTAATLWDRCGAEPDIAVSLAHRELLRATRGALGDARFEDAFAEGRRRNPHEILAPPATSASGQDEPTVLPPLTRRESEIARLVAVGLSNREIAIRLVIAQRTAETHLQHILNKLDLANRTQVAVWVNERSATRTGPGSGPA